MDGAMILLSIVAFAVGSFWLCLYVYGLYLGGKWLASRFRSRYRPTVAAVLIAVCALVVDIPVLPFGMEWVYKSTLLFALWLLHAQPVVLGYWAEYDTGRESDQERWTVRTEEWLSDFENRPPECLREYLGNPEDS